MFRVEEIEKKRRRIPMLLFPRRTFLSALKLKPPGGNNLTRATFEDLVIYIIGGEIQKIKCRQFDAAPSRFKRN